MSITLDTTCLLCHFERNLKTARGLGTEEQAMAFARGLMRMYLDSPRNVGATWYGPQVDELLREIYGLEGDRFAGEKRRSNAFVLERMERIREKVRSAPDPVYAGLQFSVLGNYIDFSALRGEVSFEKLDAMMEDALKMDLDRAVYRRLCGEFEKGSSLLYLTDNAGEIGFDRILAEEIHRKYPHLAITFCVRGGNTMNDATRLDAEEVGIPFPVIDNGNLVAGTVPELLSGEAKLALETADVILAKGQANTETLLDSGYNIYYAFLVKCVRFIERYGKPKLTPMLVAERK